jgi:hypothetical protein
MVRRSTSYRVAQHDYSALRYRPRVTRLQRAAWFAALASCALICAIVLISAAYVARVGV